MDAVEEFRAAVERRDFSKLDKLFTQDTAFYSPVKMTPFKGRDMVVGLLRVVLETFEEFRYIGELDGAVEDHSDAPLPASILVFRAKIGDIQIHGLDLIHLNDDGLISEFTVMVRPLSAAHALSDAVGAALVEAGLIPPPA